MTPEHIEALRRLVKALGDFLATGFKSEGSGNVDDPHAGMDPDELACESVEPGGATHNAVCALQPFYGGKLPAPEARNPWLELQKACRHEADRFKRQTEAHRYAGILRDWARVEIERLKPEPPPVALTPEEQTVLEALATESPMTVTQENLAGATGLSDRTVRKYLGELRDRGFVDQPRGPKKGFAITSRGLAAIGRG